MGEEQKENTGYSEEELFDMSDEELNVAFKEAKASINNEPDPVADEPEVNGFEENNVDGDEDDTDNDNGDEEDLEQSTDDNESDDEDVDSEEDSDDDDEEENNDGEKESDNTDGEGTEGESDKTNDEGEPKADVKTEADKPVIDLTEKRKFRAVGKDYEFSIQEMLDSYATIFGQAVDYTKKSQVFKEHRPLVETAVAANLTVDDLNLLADAINKKSPEAVAEIIKKAEVDPLELDVEADKEFVPTRYGRTAEQITVDEALESISVDPEFAITENVIVKQWDEASQEIMAKDPRAIQGLHGDIKSGLFDIVSPRAMKMKLMDGGRRPDIEYYVAAGNQYLTEKRQQELTKQAMELEQRQQQESVKAEADRLAKLKADEAKRKQKSVSSKKRKAAGTTKSRAGKKTAIDYLDESDEAYDEWYKNLEDSL